MRHDGWRCFGCCLFLLLAQVTICLDFDDQNMNSTVLTWHDAIGTEKQQPYFTQLWQRVKQARQAGAAIYPSSADVFSAFSLTDFSAVKVVICLVARNE